ncbi:MAG: helix-turn-helix domain-containing protein [Treponema sp.]|nr:helix-turn-helix domain-containing protein [Treponema sp.]
MSNICQRVVNLREFLGLNQSSFATELDIKRPTLAGYEKGTFPPSTDFLIKIRELHNVNIDWLLTGIGEMFLASLPVKAGKGYKIPLLRQKVSCGPGVDWQNEDNIIDYIDIFDQIPRLKIDRLIALRVEGSSMLGAGIRNGDYVLFNSAIDQWPHDGIYVFALDGEVYCKRLEFDMKKIKIYSVRVADLEKAELMETLDNKDNAAANRLTIFGRVLYWVHPNVDE